jgi:organic hydroperoxide reductase OsmC/OhrA
MSSVGEDGQLHKYACSLSWRGSTADGYEAYSRQHSVVVAPSEIELRLSADPVFRGDAAELNPEQLLLVAASSCQLLEFLALAARSRVAVISYEDRASASMDERARPPKVTEIRLSPSITVARETDATRVERLVEKAHAGCYIANSLKCAMEIDPVIRHET